MNIIRNTEQPEDLEPFTNAVRRHRQQLRGRVKGKVALKSLSRFMAAADVQRGLVAPPA